MTSLLRKAAGSDKRLVVKGNLLPALLRFSSETFETQSDL